MCIRDRDDIDAIGVTYGPGLVGALLVGVAEAKAISYAKNIPLVGDVYKRQAQGSMRILFRESSWGNSIRNLQKLQMRSCQNIV